MTRVEKKIWPEYFDAVASGKKTFELRLNDFAIAEGDTLVLREWDPKTKEYTGRVVEKTVGYVKTWSIDDLKKFWHQTDMKEKGIVVMSLKDK